MRKTDFNNTNHDHNKLHVHGVSASIEQTGADPIFLGEGKMDISEGANLNY